MIILHQLVLDTVDAIRVLHQHDRITQALILLYAAIDTLAWLDTPDPYTSGQAFRLWVDRYLLPGTSLPCTSADLYAARCGLLHTHTAESSTTASRQARQIWYHTGEKSRRLLEYEAAGRAHVVFVRVVDLVEAFAEASQRFATELGSDTARLKAAQEKARRWLAWVPASPAG